MTRRLSALLLLATGAMFAQTVPRPAGELTIRLPFGQAKLSDYKGKVIVLGFILTTCPHCQQTTRMLSGIQPEYSAKGVQFLEAAFNQDAPQKLAEFIQLYKPTFPVGTLDSITVQSYAQISPTTRATVPIIFFIDRNMVIRAEYFGGDKIFNEGDQTKNIRAEIDKLLAEAPAKPAAPAKTPAKKK